MNVTPLSDKHLGELDLAISRALVQWCPNVSEPREIVVAMDRVLLFLKQNGGAARQARQVSSLAFLVGEQLVKLGGWRWASVSEDGSVNPSVVSPDGRRACLVVDMATLLVAGEAKGGVRTLVQACLDGAEHPLVVTL